MKKLGFTLTEIMITMGIIGVVAVLTLPTLFSDYQKQQTATSLAKAINTLETANQEILRGENVDDLVQLENTNGMEAASSTKYMKALQKYVRLSKDTNGWLKGKDGISFKDCSSWRGNTRDGNEKYSGISCEMDIDINGPKGKNTMAVDRFRVWIDSKGSVIPFGSYEYLEYLYNNNYYTNRDESWVRYCNGSNVYSNNRAYCTGNIVDNGYTIKYEL